VRRLITVSMLALVVPAVVVAVPVVSAPQASPHPVAATMHHVAISPMLALEGATPSRPLTLVAQQATSKFRAVGLSWRTPPSGGVATLRAQIEVRSGGQWSGWQELDSSDPGTDSSSDGPNAPTAATTRDGTDPLWVDHGDGVAIRLLSVTGAEPVDLRVDLIDPGSSPADATAGTAPAVSSAQADAAQPTILTRADWGADESLRMSSCPSGPQYTGMPKVAILHHTDTTNNYAPQDVPAIIRSIYAFHVEAEDWCDVGYNFLVDRFGRIWEGRYGGIDKPVLGAHAGGFNTNTFGVGLIGTFTSAQPTQAMLDGTAQLMAWKLALSYANPVGTATLTAAPFSEVRYKPGTQVSFNVISGHRDADQTSCPGNAAYALLPQLRQEVLTDMGAGLVNPNSIVTTPRTVGTNGTVHVVAGMLAPGSWQLLVQDASGTAVRTITGSGAAIDTTWDMTSDAGTPVPAGAYTITLSSAQNNQTARPWTTSLVVGGVFGSLETATTQIGQISLSGWAARAADTNPAALNITIDGALAGSVTPSSPRPDVTATYPQYTGNLGYSASEPATPGYHNLCVVGVDDDIGIPDTTVGCRGVVVPGVVAGHAVPTGNLEIAWPAVGAIRVGGWALDADTPDPIAVHVYVDGTFRGAYVASGNRPDVASAFPGMGAGHGFGALVGQFYGGPHKVCVYAINAGGGVNPALGCATVTLPAGNPRGSLNIAQGLPGAIRVVGWALDPDTSMPIATHVYVDGHWTGAVTANLVRPDVASAFPGYGAGHGFDVTVPVVGGGQHQVCTYAINVGHGSVNPKFGCATVTMPTGPPGGTLDVVQGQSGGVRIAGWSIDPDTTGPVQVHVYVNGVWTAAITANTSRPDVGSAHPGYGDQHGFDTTVPLAAGAHTVCVYAINVGPVAANPKLGCAKVTSS
jgi:hypothetical protein